MAAAPMSMPAILVALRDTNKRRSRFCYAGSMQPDILGLTARQLLTRGRVIVLVLLALLPPLLALLFVLSDSDLDPELFLVRDYLNLVYTIVVPITALVFAAAALGSEVEDGTIVYLLLKPVPRWQIVVSKLTVSVLVIAVFNVICIYVTALILGKGVEELHVAFAFALGAVLGGAAYAAMFCFLGLVTSRALIGGLFYVFIWEGLITRLFDGTRNYSVREYMRGLADAYSTLPNDIFNADLTGERALISALVAVALFTLLAVQQLRTINIT
jgi:ABC-2 type transport system permease protein